VGRGFGAAHVELCELVPPDPDELADRLAEIIKAAVYGSCLDERWD
jgi:hypothetical protein